MKEILELQKIAQKARINVIKQVYDAKSGHIGGSLSCIDILTVLYFKVMNCNKNNLEMKDRDRFILSKGHVSPALYSILALKGFIKEEELMNFRKLGSILQGHPDKNKVPGVEMSTGSLGQGLSTSVGIALASKMKRYNNKVFCLLGDGEIEEGQVWEAAMSAAHYKLDNLIVIIDNNNLQIDGKISDVMNPYPIKEKFDSFGFKTFEVDGNNIEELVNLFKNIKATKDVPIAIIAKTIKGKGISFMENKAQWHGKAPNEEEYKLALEELEG